MSEQTKNRPNTAEIVVSIICVLILIVRWDFLRET